MGHRPDLAKTTSQAEGSTGERSTYSGFVGPTGVGRTTTLAKLAARYALPGEKVGIITIDHYRIGAVEQMRTYSDITGLPLEVVMTPKELRRAVRSFSGCQRILIDTAGRSTLNLTHSGTGRVYSKAATL